MCWLLRLIRQEVRSLREFAAEIHDLNERWDEPSEIQFDPQSLSKVA